MPLFKSRFRRALESQTSDTVLDDLRADNPAVPVLTDEELDALPIGVEFFHPDARLLGVVFGRTLMQAQSDGCSRVQFRFATHRMIFTLDGVDYEMVPLPSPADVDLCRLLCSEARVRSETTGRLIVPFRDTALELEVEYCVDDAGPDENDDPEPYVEVRGFQPRDVFGRLLDASSESEEGVPSSAAAPA